MAVSPFARPLLAALLASTALVAPLPVLAQAMPTGGRVVSGAVTLGPVANGAMTITQSSPTAIVNWQGFSVGQGNTLTFRQPDAGSAILNRVTGSTPSSIAGQVRANGQVYLVNPNGIAITPSGKVEAGGGFVASTLDIADEDFLAGRRTFRGSGSSAAVTNDGSITVSRGGFIALLGGSVAHGGTITVPMGRVGLGAGEQATLDLSGDGFLQVAVPTKAGGPGALVAQSGVIRAEGGRVTLTAAAAREMARQAVNLSGTVDAHAVSGRSGDIVLSGGDGSVGLTGRVAASGGRVRASGRRIAVAGSVDVSGTAGGSVSLKATERLAVSGTVRARGTAGAGGSVEATAPAIALTGAMIDVSGTSGGGMAHIGGGRQGGGDLAHAQTLDVDAGTRILAEADVSGRGGDVVLWSDEATAFAGTISARGVTQGGDAEVSSKGHLTYAGTADLTASRGAFGTLLLDPYDVTISNDPDKTSTGFTATGNSSNINATTLLTALNSADVTVSSSGNGNQAGVITLMTNTPLSWTSGSTLTLLATNTITLNSAIFAPSGGLTVASGAQIAPNASISVARFKLTQGDWIQNTANLPAFSATADFRITGGTFLRAAGGDGVGSPYQITDVYGLQGIGTSATYLSRAYVLTQTIDASGTATWNDGAGFRPIGYNGKQQFTGSLDGQGNIIKKLTINDSSNTWAAVALFSMIDSSSVLSNVGLVDANIIVSGNNTKFSIGTLVGDSSGKVANSYATGSISAALHSNSATVFVGGLIGWSEDGSSIQNSYANVSVTASNSFITSDVYVGGLVGDNRGSITRSYATGQVSASAVQGTGSQSGAGFGYAGGLIGYNEWKGSISEAWASGGVLQADFKGGLMGSNSVSNPVSTSSYWDMNTTGQSQSTGTGIQVGTGLSTSQARSQYSYGGFDFANIWYQTGDSRPILRTELKTLPYGQNPISNAHQLALMGANPGVSYILTNDIDAAELKGNFYSSQVWGANGIGPAGSSSSPFTGTLDGAGYTIANLQIAGGDGTGLIGTLGAGGTVKNIALVNATVTGGTRTGALVGDNFGTISQAYARGTVNGSTQVGGLVGQNENGGKITAAYSTATVNGTTTQIGGLVGNNIGTLQQVYATGAVSGSGAIGGLVGAQSGTVSAAFWNTDAGRSNATGSGSSTGITGLTTAKMQDLLSYKTNYSGFDFDTVWAPPNKANQGGAASAHYPELYAVSLVSTVTTADASITYGDAIPTAGTPTYKGLRTGDTVAIAATAAFPSTAKDAGSYAATFTAPSISGVHSNYRFVYLGGLTINPKMLTISGTKIYNGKTDVVFGGLTASGVLGGEKVTISAGSGTTGAADTGVYKAVSLTGLDFTVTNGKKSNYILPSAGDIIVNPAKLTVTANAASKTYDGQSYANGNGVSYSGFVNGEDATVLTGSPIYGGDAQGARNAGQYTITVSGLNAKNYAITFADGALTIDKAHITATLDGEVRKTYDGTTTATLPAGVLGLDKIIGADTVTVSGTAAAYDNATGGTGKTVTVSGLTLSGDDAANYVLTATTVFSAIGTIDRKTLTVTAKDLSKTYDGQIYTGGSGVDYAGFVTGEDASVLGGSLVYGGSAKGVKNAGRYTIAVSGLSSDNYAFDYVDGALTIAKASLTATLNAVSKTYDGTNAAPLSPALLGVGPVIGSDVVTVSGTATYDNAKAGIGKTVTATGLTLGGADADNYVLTATTVWNGSSTIDRKGLTVTAKDVSRTYDGTAYTGGSDVGYDGFITGEDASVLGGALAYGGTAKGAKNAGQYVIALSGLTSKNYTVHYVDGALSIAKASLTATLTGNVQKTYDGTTTATLPAGVLGLDKVIGADAVTVSGTATYDTATAGTGKTITVAGLTLTGADAGNYVLTAATAANTIGTIDRKTLTVTAKDLPKTYDGKVYTGGSGVDYAGFVTGEDASVLGGSLVYGGSAKGVKNAGRYTIAVSGLSSDNYAFDYVDGALDIARASLTATLTGTVRKTYDGTTTATLAADTIALDKVFGADAVTVSGTATYDSAKVGTGKTITVTGLALSGADADNYVLTATTAANAIGTVDRKTLTVTAKDVSRTYDGTAFSGGGGVDYAGFVTGEDASVLGGAPVYGGAAKGAKNAGRYAIAVSGLSADNYAFDYVDGALTIAKASLTATLTGTVRKTYDGTRAATLAAGMLGLDKVIGADAVTVSGTATYDTATAGTGKTITVAGLTLTGADAGNYVLTATTAANAIGTIDRKSLTVTARDLSKTYDGKSYSGGSGVDYAGFVAGEDASVLGGSLVYGGTAKGAKNAGRYTISVSGLSSDNYAFDYKDGALDIGKASLTVTARDLSKTYDGKVYTGGSGVDYDGFVTGEDASVLGGSLVYGGTAKGAKNAGRYTISVSGLSSDNYTVAYRSGTLTVDQALLTVVAKAASRSVGESNPALPYTATGLVDGDTLSGALATTADETSPAGRYDITQGSLSAGANYTLSYTGALLTVVNTASSSPGDGAAGNGGGSASSGGGDEAQRYASLPKGVFAADIVPHVAPTGSTLGQGFSPEWRSPLPTITHGSSTLPSDPQAGEDGAQAGKANAEAGEDGAQAGKANSEAGEDGAQAGEADAEAGEDGAQAGEANAEAGEDGAQAGEANAQAELSDAQADIAAACLDKQDKCSVAPKKKKSKKKKRAHTAAH